MFVDSAVDGVPPHQRVERSLPSTTSSHTAMLPYQELDAKSTAKFEMSNFNAVAIALFIIGLYSLLVAHKVYRSWKRLCHIPASSWLAGVSSLWLAKTTYSGRQYWIHRELHRKLGPLVRVGPNEIVTDDPEIFKHVNSARSRYSRSPYYQAGRFNPYHDNLLSMLDTEEHRKAKLRSSAAYSGRETPGWERAIDEHIEVLIAVLRERYAVPSSNGQRPLLDLGRITCFFTMDVITSMAFGKSVGYLKDEKDYYDFFATLRTLWPQMSTAADVPWIRKILFSPLFLRLLGPKSTDSRGFGALMGVAERFVKGRFSSKASQQGDMLDSLMKRGFNQQECEVEGLLVLLAGTESTACAIRSAVVHTITAPLAYTKLKEEVMTAVTEGKVSKPVTTAEANQLPYLQAVVYESIRMRPPLLGFWQKIVPGSGDRLCGKEIPPGTSIGINHSALLRSTALFGEDADVFSPERFMRLDTLQRREMERSVELAFGHGPWMCAGKSVALTEIAKFVFELFREFDVQLVSPFTPCSTKSYGVFLEERLLCRVTSTS